MSCLGRSGVSCVGSRSSAPDEERDIRRRVIPIPTLPEFVRAAGGPMDRLEMVERQLAALTIAVQVPHTACRAQTVPSTEAAHQAQPITSMELTCQEQTTLSAEASNQAQTDKPHAVAPMEHDELSAEAAHSVQSRSPTEATPTAHGYAKDDSVPIEPRDAPEWTD
jgi:hypothetical protein